MTEVNHTHAAGTRSWLAAANAPGTDFPVQNLPFCAFRRRGSGDTPRCGIAIGDRILDITQAAAAFAGAAAQPAAACAHDTLNALMAMPPTSWSALRARLFDLLSDGASEHRSLLEEALVPIDYSELQLPLKVAGYTDFFASLHHATNAGRLFRPDQPLLPNYKYVPVGYNGRAASIQLGFESVRRPKGQICKANAETPSFAPSEKLDYEVELAFLVGNGASKRGSVALDRAWDHVFGACLLNDWSARDLQAWEAQPLGPFLAKSFATSISPWIVTAEALAPFRTQAARRPAGDPAPLSHLLSENDQANGAVHIVIDALLATKRMRAEGLQATRLSRSDSATLYWTPAQMLTHHTSNGSHLQTGDLIGSGTISGPDESSMGSLLELSRGGSTPLQLPSGEVRRFLEDGDEVILQGHCERAGFARIGFGECRSTILPAD